MSFLVPLSRKHIIENGLNNSLQFEFRGSSVNFSNMSVAVHSISIFNSHFNVDQYQYGNNTLSIQVPSGSSYTVVPITLPNGYFAYADMSRLIQKSLFEAGAYLLDGSGNVIHYFQLSENASFYACQADLLVVPTTLPAGWSLPPSGIWSSGLPTAARTMKMTITNASFGSLIGFTPGDYPSANATTTQTFLSNQTPQVNPVSSYLLRCSLISNPFTSPSDILTSFSNQGTTIGDIIDYRPSQLSFFDIPDGSYQTITLMITDQNDNQIHFREKNTLITLEFREKRA